MKKYIQFKNDNITEIIEFINQTDVDYSTATFIDNKGVTEGMQINLKAKHKNKINSIFLRNEDYLVLEQDGLRKYNKVEFELNNQKNIITERQQIHELLQKELEEIKIISTNLYNILHQNCIDLDVIKINDVDIKIEKVYIGYFIYIEDKNTQISNKIAVGKFTEFKNLKILDDNYIEYNFPVDAEILRQYAIENLKILETLKRYVDKHIKSINDAKYENLTKQVLKIK